MNTKALVHNLHWLTPQPPLSGQCQSPELLFNTLPIQQPRRRVPAGSIHQLARRVIVSPPTVQIAWRRHLRTDCKATNLISTYLLFFIFYTDSIYSDNKLPTAAAAHSLPARLRTNTNSPPDQMGAAVIKTLSSGSVLHKTLHTHTRTALLEKSVRFYHMLWIFRLFYSTLCCFCSVPVTVCAVQHGFHSAEVCSEWNPEHKSGHLSPHSPD